MSADTFTKPQRMHFYNYDKLYSYNGIFNFLCGARGLGKTFGIKLKVLKANLEKGEQFILVRRYKDELKKTKAAFFADIDAEGFFTEWDFRIHGDAAQKAHIDTRDDKKREWDTIGFFVPLSTSQSIKGVSFAKVRTIIYDEFIIEKGMTQYLPDEATVFTNFYSTVDRYRDECRVFFLANSVSINNPYFIEYNIKPDEVKEFHRSHEGFVVCHFADSADFQNDVYKTRFGRFIQNTEYADYAVGSEFKDNHDGLLAFKPSEAEYFYSLETKSGTFSVWVDWQNGYYYIQNKRPKKEAIMTLLSERMKEGKTLLFNNDKLIADMRTSFRKGYVFFDSAQARNAFIDIFRR